MYGLVCLSAILLEQSGEKNTFKNLTRKRFLELGTKEGLKVLEERCLYNLKQTIRIIEHCNKINIRHYRLSSSLFPLVTDSSLNIKIEDFSNYAEIVDNCKKIGEIAKKFKISLSLHPDQYCVLGSPTKKVRDKTVVELNFYAKILDLMGQPRDYSCPINIHPSCSAKTGEQKEFEKIIDRIYESFLKCDEGVRKRLVFENEHGGSWNCKHLFMYFFNYCGTKHGHFFPLTYDNNHDFNNPSDLDGKIVDMIDNISAFESSWPEPYIPVFHWSWGKVENFRHHADYAQRAAPDYPNRKLKWEAELKASDKAILKLRGEKINITPKKKKAKPIDNRKETVTIHRKETTNPFNQIYV